jgi:DnaD/phage-associated family protein
MEQHENKFFELYGKIIAQDGVTPIPMALFRYQKELRLDCTELVFICYVMTYRWTAGDPYPSIKKMAIATGISEKTLHNYKSSLVSKNYLRLVKRSDPRKGNMSNGYDFSPLLETLEKIILSKSGEDPVRASLLVDEERRENGSIRSKKHKDGGKAFINKARELSEGSCGDELSTLSTLSTKAVETSLEPPAVKITVPPTVKSTAPPTVKITEGVSQEIQEHPAVNFTAAPLSNLQRQLTPSTDELNKKDLLSHPSIYSFSHSNKDDKSTPCGKNTGENNDAAAQIREALQYAGFAGTPLATDLLKEHPLLLIREALKKAVLGGIYRLDYVIGTLNKWAEKGFSTVEEVEEEARAERYRRTSPWPSPGSQRPTGSKPGTSRTYERRYT